MAIQIPEEDRDKVASLLSLQPEALQRLRAVLSEVEPRLRVRDLVDEVVSRLDLPRRQISDTISTLATLYWLVGEVHLAPEEVIGEFFEAAQKTGDDRLKVDEAKRNALFAPLSDLLSLEHTLGVTSKAAFVASQVPLHYHGAKVLTDARPVFTSDPSTAPAAFVINHTLQVRGRGNDENTEWFISLDANDLRDLKDAVERALEKEKSLKAFMEKTGVPVLGRGGD